MEIVQEAEKNDSTWVPTKREHEICQSAKPRGEHHFACPHLQKSINGHHQAAGDARSQQCIPSPVGSLMSNRCGRPVTNWSDGLMPTNGQSSLWNLSGDHKSIGKEAASIPEVSRCPACLPSPLFAPTKSFHSVQCLLGSWWKSPCTPELWSANTVAEQEKGNASATVLSNLRRWRWRAAHGSAPGGKSFPN